MRTYPNFIIFCPSCPPFRPGPTVAGLLPHVIWAELRYRSGRRALHSTLFEVARPTVAG